ncbi:MAG: amidase, partial [Melioribacteraceae bacterium]
MKHYSRNILFVLFSGLFLFNASLFAQQKESKIKKEMIPNAEKIIGLEFTDAERDSMQDALNDQLNNYENIRKVHLDNSIPPAILFNPIPVGFKFDLK